MSGASAVGGSGCVSGKEGDSGDSPHPTSTAAIVVSRRCFMSPKAQLNCVLFAIVLKVHIQKKGSMLTLSGQAPLICVDDLFKVAMNLFGFL